MLSIKSFKHDRYFCNNSKHNLSKCKIIKMRNSERSTYNKIAIDNLKQMMINCVIFTYLNNYYYSYDYYYYNFIEYLGINFLNVSNQYVFYNYDYYLDNYYCCSKQLHYQQKLLENEYNEISNNLNITIYSKYTQSWIINNFKKIAN